MVKLEILVQTLGNGMNFTWYLFSLLKHGNQLLQDKLDKWSIINYKLLEL